jgi:hypothetical protein
MMWRDSMRPARFGPFDGRSAFFVLLTGLHLATWTVTIAFLAMVLFWLLERKGLRVDSAFRLGRCWLAGRSRPALLPRLRRRTINYG